MMTNVLFLLLSILYIPVLHNLVFWIFFCKMFVLLDEKLLAFSLVHERYSQTRKKRYKSRPCIMKTLTPHYESLNRS